MDFITYYIGPLTSCIMQEIQTPNWTAVLSSAHHASATKPFAILFSSWSDVERKKNNCFTDEKHNKTQEPSSSICPQFSNYQLQIYVYIYAIIQMMKLQRKADVIGCYCSGHVLYIMSYTT
ncbi:hypothetical protein SAY86_010580 [Trapa natans]|uniref:Uncharacterized protein n=1 Tax=Trapa natans TaxID=22666 RepID=A0AAN7LHD4_TRANT|nr:hypothetical protein SAY86_010580 [Trapa natans]